jgi:hypothetical protein
VGRGRKKRADRVAASGAVSLTVERGTQVLPAGLADSFENVPVEPDGAFTDTQVHVDRWGNVFFTLKVAGEAHASALWRAIDDRLVYVNEYARGDAWTSSEIISATGELQAIEQKLQNAESGEFDLAAGEIAHLVQAIDDRLLSLDDDHLLTTAEADDSRDRLSEMRLALAVARAALAAAA